MKQMNGAAISIKPHKRASSTHDLTQVSRNNPEALYKKFIAFLDDSPNTIRTYKLSLRQWVAYLKQNHITQPTWETVKNYKDALIQQGKKLTTVQNYLMAVKQLYRWTEAAHIYPNIAKNVKGIRLGRSFKKDYLTSKQVRHVLGSIDQSTLKGKRNYSMLLVMFTMGLRTIEISRANVEDIKPGGDTTVLEVQGKGHNEKDAPVRMPEMVEAAVRDYLHARGKNKPEQPLFASTSHHNYGGRMTTQSISRIAKSTFRAAGYDSPRITAHSTRHTAATLSLLNGASLQETQMLLRHKSMSTTEIYAHNLKAATNPAAEDVQNAILGLKGKDRKENESKSNHGNEPERRHRQDHDQFILNGWVIK